MAGQDPLRRVPRGLETPLPFLFLTPIEWAVMMLGFGIFSILLGQFVLGMVMAVGFVYVYRKTAGNAKRGFYMHRLWRAGLPMDPLIRRNWPKGAAVDLTE